MKSESSPYRRLLAGSAAVLAIAFHTAEARVTRFVVEQRVPLANAGQWGPAGPYEKLIGTAHMEVDPQDPLNAVIVNLDKAPRNARGRVEYSAPFVILKPVDLARGNRKLWYGVNNRGNCSELNSRAFPSVSQTCNPASLADVGTNNIFLQEGYTWVDAGWHGDGTPVPDRSKLFPSFPVAKNPDGSSITGLNRREFQTSATTFTMHLATYIGVWRPYEPADTSTAHAILTVRDKLDGPRNTIDPARWSFASCPDGLKTQTPSRGDICLADGFQPDKIYELIYTAKDPIVMGLAYAVTRDIGAFLRNQTHDDTGTPNPLAMTADTVGIKHTYISGISSTGMYLREFLYLGFNEDESHRKVFDGAAIFSAGAMRLFANVQFAHPSVLSFQWSHRDYTSNAIAPFTFAVTTDPLTGLSDGILKRPATDPYVIQLDEEGVFWQWKASLNVVDTRGNPVPIPPNARLYHLNGWGHVTASGLLSPPQDGNRCANPVSGGGGTPAMARVLVKLLDDWVARGIAPPDSNYPTLKGGALVSKDEYGRLFPKISGVAPPAVINELTPLDYGPAFGPTGGIQSLHPPRTGANGSKYALLVPRPGLDGTPAVGIDTLWTRAPLGTNLGWNMQKPPGENTCLNTGSYLPLPATKAERLASGDPRLSLEERYKDHRGFVAAVKKAAQQLVTERFLLQEDANTLVKAAEDSDVLKARSH